MSTPTENSQYLLLFRGTNWHEGLSVQEIQEIVDRTDAWFDRIAREGKFKAAQPLEREGVTVSYRNGSIIDGPFAESKESIGGFLLLEAGNFDEAMAIARENPMIPYGIAVEVRPVAETCPTTRIALEKVAAAV